MTEGVLYIGQRRYSSWSMRGWLAVELAGLDVDVRVLQFTRPGPTKAIAEVSPNGLVPFLEHNGARVWESLAICDYCAELAAGAVAGGPGGKGHARSMSAEMHAGFRELREGDVDEPGAGLFRASGGQPGALQRYRPDRGVVG